METLHKDGDICLDSHAKEVAGALDEASRDPGMTSTQSSMDSTSFAASAVVATATSKNIFVTSTSKFLQSSNSAKPNQTTNSLFVGGAAAKMAKERTPLVPLGYGEKKKLSAGAKGDELVTRSKITGMSLTGLSFSGAQSVPIRGANVTNTTLTGRMRRDLTTLKQELANVRQAMEKPYEGGTRRLVKDLANGKSGARQVAQRNPAVLLNTAPKMVGA